MNEQVESREARPEPAEKKKNHIYDVVIKQLDFGYIVKVGCNSFAFETNKKLIEKLSQYLENPENIEKKWQDGEFLK